MRLLNEHDVDALASVKRGLAAARETAGMVAAGTLTTGRVQISNETAWMRILAGLVPDLDLIGHKEFHRVGKHVHYHVSLFRQSTGEPLGIIDGRRITSLRTACTAALPFRQFFEDREVDLAVIGSGEEAKEGLRAVAECIRLRSVTVFSPTESNREAFALKASEDLGRAVGTAASLGDALAGANAAYVATGSQTTFVHAEDVAGLEFLAAVGATRPDHHELAGDVIATAGQVIVDCGDALHEPGDMIDATTQCGWDSGTAVLLGRYLDGGGPPAVPGVVVYKSIGSVEQDLVLAYRLLEAAASEGRGTVVPVVASLRTMR